MGSEDTVEDLDLEDRGEGVEGMVVGGAGDEHIYTHGSLGVGEVVLVNKTGRTYKSQAYNMRVGLD